MKDIKEISDNYAMKSNCTLGEHDKISKAFMDGFEFANKWIDVKDELPKRGCSYFNDSDTVLIKIKIENGAIKVLTGHYDLDFKKWHIDADNYNEIVITHWRPIEYK